MDKGLKDPASEIPSGSCSNRNLTDLNVDNQLYAKNNIDCLWCIFNIHIKINWTHIWKLTGGVDEEVLELIW